MEARTAIGLSLVAIGAGAVVAFEASAGQIDRTNPFYIGGAVIAVLGVTLLAWGLLAPTRSPEASPAVSGQAAGATVTAGRDAVLQQGGSNVVVQAGGNYYSTHPLGEDDDRVLVQAGPLDLSSLYRDHMTVEADRLFDRFKDHWMRVEGGVDNISDYRKWTTVTVGDPLKGESAHLNFADDEQRKRVLVKRKGEWIRALGRIDSASVFGVALEDCELDESGAHGTI